MRRNLLAKSLLGVFVFLVLEPLVRDVSCKTIEIDGNLVGDNEWSILPSTIVVLPNTSILYNDEWIFIDSTGDIQTTSLYPDSVTVSLDLQQARITADRENLYFYFQFPKLLYGESGRVYPLIQVGLNIPESSSGREELVEVPTSTYVSKVNKDAPWNLLFLIYQTTSTDAGSSNLIKYITDRGGSGYVGEYNHFATTGTDNLDGDTFFIEASIPIGGIEEYIIGKRLNFSIAVFMNAGAFAGYDNGTVMRYSTQAANGSNVVDAVSLYTTDVEVADNTIDWYYSIKFSSPTPNIYVNNPPEKPVNLKVDNVVNNREVVISQHNPTFSWTFVDKDTDDVQLGVQIQISTEASFNTNLWMESPIVYKKHSIALPAEVISKLCEGSTYYFRIRTMDSFGMFSEWSEVNSFYTIKPQVPFSTAAAADVIVDWNNPFSPAKGEVTKIRYVVYSGNEYIALYVYNFAGELVKVLREDTAEKDVIYTIPWDGTNMEGNVVSEGIYFINLCVSSKKFYKTVPVAVIR